MPTRIAIIGGGAAGMMVAATLLERTDGNPEIHIFEKNKKLGAKVIISGGGRCNVTTGVFKIKELVHKYPRGGDFVTPALQKFGPKAIVRRFEHHGVPLKQEDDGRVFPVSDDGKDIVGVFERLFAESGVHMHLAEKVTDMRVGAKDTSGFSLTSSTHTYSFDTIVLTTGGNAYVHTGSSGDGYAFARDLGHTITPLGPSLNSFLTAEERLYPCSGISFPDAELSSSVGSVVKSSGPVLLTHFGLSGPAVFAFSSHIPYEPVTKALPYTIRFRPDAKKDLAYRQHCFTRRAIDTPKKELGTLLREFFPRKFIDTLLSQYGFDVHLTIGNMSKQDRLSLARYLGEGMPLTLIQRRPGDEFVTAGGVSLDEVDPENGQSRLVPGLYFAGEILDIDGYTGGYNLTSSWAMGRLVGKYMGL